jgi:RimJ/RimL family protein N-acetyltransferase
MFPDLTRDDVFRIETARLWLRWPRAVDAPAFARLASDQDVARLMTCLPQPFGADEAGDFVLGARRANADGRGIVLALSPRNDPGAFVGMVGVQSRMESRADVASGEADLVLGYWLGKPYWGQGLMQEAIEAVLDMAFMLPDAQTIEAPVREGHVAARKVLARCGFPKPPAGASHSVITREAWLGARSRAASRIALPLA